MSEYKLIRNPNTHTVSFSGPYSAEFQNRLKKAVGRARFDYGRKCWTIPEADEGELLNLVYSVYRWKDTDPEENVSLNIHFKQRLSIAGDAFILFNETVARVSSKKDDVLTGKYVSVQDGEFGLEGSRQNCKLIIPAGMKIRLADVPLNVYQRLKIEEETRYHLEVETTSKIQTNRQALLKEKAQLENRLKEIEAELDRLNS